MVSCFVTMPRIVWLIVLIVHAVVCDDCSLRYYENDPFDSEIFVTGGDANPVLDDITDHHILSCMTAGQSLAEDEFQHGEWLAELGINLKKNSSGYFRFNTGLLPTSVTNSYRASCIMLKGLEIFLNTYTRTYSTSASNLMEQLYKKRFRLHGICEQASTKLKCSKNRRYRTYDGSCNNLKHPDWGMTYSIHTRMAFPNYADGIHEPARSVLGVDLPSAREVSNTIFTTHEKPDSHLALLAGEIAQLIAHDCTMVINDFVDEGPIMCCTEDGSSEIPDYLRHKSCLPIAIPENDPFFKKFGRRCMQYVRSITAPKSSCILSPAEQINGVTSYMDCNFVYGFTEERARSLRSFRSGQLLESSSDKGPMLPLTNSSICDVRSDDEICYRAGDNRVNQNPHLVTMQTVFLREHNRIARCLKQLNSHWNDERVYQETRRIVIAMYQHIVYQEYLPVILGESFAKILFSGADGDGYTNSYDESVNPGCLNSMNIIFRCFHSTVPKTLRTYSDNCDIVSEHKFSDYLLRPVFSNKHYDNILNSLSCSPMMRMGDSVTTEIANKLFKSYSPFGLDLMALDIQRSRDHGIPGYNTFREICGLKKVTSFDELIPDMGKKRVDRLKRCYAHVDDIDLLVGGMLEKRLNNTHFGPVILYILREQFYRFMIGDRYFYTNINQPYPFTPAQLEQIKKASIAKLICDNGNNVGIIQARAFVMPSENNPRVKCMDLPRIDFDAWKEHNPQACET